MDKVKDELRKRAELLLCQSSTQLANLPPEALQKLLYEFQVYQIELELQNEELKHSQQEVMASRDRYAKLYNSSPVGYLTLDAAGTIQKANPAAAHDLDSTPEALKNKKLAQFIQSDDQDSYYFFIKNILSKHTEQQLVIRLNSLTSKNKCMTCQGVKYCGCLPNTCMYSDNIIYIECRGTYNVNEHNDPQICLIITDVTASKKAQDTIACLNQKLEAKVFQQTQALTEINQDLVNKITELRFYKNQITEREAKLNSIFNAAIEGIITINMAGNIVSVNNTVEHIFGYTREELINCNINKLIPLGKQKKSTHYFNNVSAIGLTSIIGKIKEVTGMCKAGNTVPLDISIAQFTIDNISYLTCIVRDVSARKLQEQRDQEHLDELAHVTRLGLMGEMASGIAHEVNQPLTAIANYSQVCLTLIANDKVDKSQLIDILKKTNQQALRAGQIIHRMRDFVKSKKIHRSTTEINELINDAVSLCESYLKQNSIQLNLKLSKHIPSLCVDSIQIEQVILNLIRNSIDALTSIPELYPKKLSIHSSINRNNDLEIRIKDNGPGINENEQTKVLTPFFSTKSDGMGMGLSICRSIIESHEGVLRFNSQSGKGTTFYFTLPIRKQANGI